MNKLLCDDNATNRSVKNLLLENYGQLICFTYSHNRRNSEMLFSSKLQREDIIVSLRQSSTHDTVLVLFQNIPKNQTLLEDMCEMSSLKPASHMKLKDAEPCQKSLSMGKRKGRGSIPANFIVSRGSFGMDCSFMENINNDYFLRALCRRKALFKSG